MGRDTWNAIVRAYDETRNSIAPEILGSADDIYPGKVLTSGQTGPEVELLQKYLIKAAGNVPEIPLITATGVYDAQTEEAIRAVQNLVGLEPSGVTGALTWDAVVSFANDG